MKRFPISLLLAAAGLYGQTHPLQELIDAARADSPRLKELLDRKDEWGNRIPELNGRDGVAVWGQEFFFRGAKRVCRDGGHRRRTAVPLKQVTGTSYWYLLKRLRLVRRISITISVVEGRSALTRWPAITPIPIRSPEPRGAG